MFLTEKAPGEVQTIKLSTAIRMGDAMGIEENITWSGCALGTAAKATGFVWNERSGVNYGCQVMDHCRKTFGLDTIQLLDISYLHSARHYSRLEIADHLARIGQ